MTLIPNLTFTDYEWFPWSICNGCGMPAGNAYPSGHLVPSHNCWTCLCSNCWDQIHRSCHVFTRLFTWNIHWYFLDFTLNSLRRRKYDPVIIEKTVRHVLGLSTAIVYKSLLEHCTLTNNAMRNILRNLSKPLQRRKYPDPRPLWLLVGTPLVLGPELASRWGIIAYSGGCLHIYWLRTVDQMVTHNIHSIAVVKTFTVSQYSHFPQKLCNQKDTHLKLIFDNNSPYKDRGPTAKKNR